MSCDPVVREQRFSGNSTNICVRDWGRDGVPFFSTCGHRGGGALDIRDSSSLAGAGRSWAWCGQKLSCLSAGDEVDTTCPEYVSGNPIWEINN